MSEARGFCGISDLGHFEEYFRKVEKKCAIAKHGKIKISLGGNIFLRKNSLFHANYEMLVSEGLYWVDCVNGFSGG